MGRCKPQAEQAKPELATLVAAFQVAAARYLRYDRVRPLPEPQLDPMRESERIEFEKLAATLAASGEIPESPLLGWGIKQLTRRPFDEAERFTIEDHLLRIRAFVECTRKGEPAGHLVRLIRVLRDASDVCAEPGICQLLSQFDAVWPDLEIRREGDQQDSLSYIGVGAWIRTSTSDVVRDVMYGLVGHADLDKMRRFTSTSSDLPWWAAYRYASLARETIRDVHEQVGELLASGTLQADSFGEI